MTRLPVDRIVASGGYNSLCGLDAIIQAPAPLKTTTGGSGKSSHVYTTRVSAYITGDSGAKTAI